MEGVREERRNDEEREREGGKEERERDSSFLPSGAKCALNSVDSFFFKKLVCTF